MRRALVACILFLATSCGIGPAAPKAAVPASIGAGAPPRMLSPVLPKARGAAKGLFPLSAAFLPDGRGIISIARCRDGSCAGSVWTTTDLGRTWSRMSTGLPPFADVSASPDGAFTGVAAAGGRPVVYLEETPGGPWVRVFTAPRGADAAGVSFATADDAYAFASGQCATQHCGLLIERTTDGGRTWVPVSANAMWNAGGSGAPGVRTVPLWEPSFLTSVGSGQLALFSGVPGEEVAVSTTGGRSWKVSFATPNTGGSAAMTSAGGGWLSYLANCPSDVGQCPSVLEHTTDGGVTWTKAGETSSPSGRLQLATAADGSPWAVLAGEGGLPEVATLRIDGGSVGLHAHAVPGGVAPASLMPLSGTTAVVLVQGPPRASLLLTRDGGKAWTTIASFAVPPLPQLAMGMWTEAAGWGLGGSGGASTFLTTSDGGSTWTARMPMAAALAGAVLWGGLFDPTHGWVASPGGLWFTANGGGTWAARHLAPGFAWRVAFQSPADGTEVLVPPGAKSGTAPKRLPHALAVTTDGGATWHIVLRSGALAGAFTPTGSLLAVVRGREGALIRKSSDDGATWTTLAATAGRDLPTSLGVTADGTLWAASFDRIWLWKKGGRPSEITFSGTVLTDPPAITSARDMKILANGAVYGSTDGGATFTLVAAPPPAPF